MSWKGQSLIKIVLVPRTYVYRFETGFIKPHTKVLRKIYAHSGGRGSTVVGFHTSLPKKAPPPYILRAIVNILRVLAINAARNMKRGSPEGRNPKFGVGTIAAGGVLGSILSYLFYISHLEECPITKRKKFVMFSAEDVAKMAKQESENIQKQFRGKLTRSGEDYKVVMNISSRILKANKNLPGIKRDWRVFVVEDRRIHNAFVLPNGDIFIFMGMLRLVSNEDQLAAVMGHEIAHALLNHVGESISNAHLFELLLLLPIIIMWIVLPDAVAIFGQRNSEYISQVLFKLPMSRQLETEADVVGTKMMARACYDPWQAVEFWRKMAKLSPGEPVEWLSTHPNSKTRSNTLRNMMPDAMDIYFRHCKT